MIYLKTPFEIDKMRKAGKVVGDLLKFLEEKIQAGMTTKQLDTLADNFIRRHNAVPSFLNYGGYPASICCSIDDEVVHGIPSDRVIEEGQIVSVDVGAILDGWQGDAARTFLIGSVSEEKKKLVEVCKESFYKGIAEFKIGNRLGDISHAVQSHVESNGFSVVRVLVGHGIGKDMHEDPNVPNYGRAGSGCAGGKLYVCTVLFPVPQGAASDRRIVPKEPFCGWTVVTNDGKPSAHYENTVALTANGIEILTL